MFGHLRNPPISLIYVLTVTASSFLHWISPVFFRRVSPVETRRYAFIRNLFAAAAVGIILFRAITSLSQAQNKIETRMKSKDCNEHGQPIDHEIQVLTEYDREIANVTVLSEYVSNAFLEPCAPMLRQSNESNWVRQILWCSIPRSQVPVFHIEVRSLTSSALTEAGMPRIWLSNKKEEDTASFEQYDRSTVRVYSPIWKLRPGFHLEAEARLITRRFISSSVFRDIVLYSDPKYAQKSLYPITETGRSGLTDSTGVINFTQATSIIRATLSPGFENYYRSQVDFWNLQRGLQKDVPQMCDYIEDYRSGSVLDALGSVGGLFALLHAAHVLLFGRPLLWGFTGAKLITPLGMLGIFSSADFKRRLRENYHRQPTQDNPEPFRIGAFLRDFVIDLGPAGIPPDQDPDLDVSSPKGDREGSSETQMYVAMSSRVSWVNS
ncbi:hypothetical protein RSOLAG22IIIB_07812 [Rhizoctonia solani]|uniref:Kex protein n=1 Tax=Rhizoctonia solani TaxID=456999 RepID=A0A0K6FQL4_9AGAM|nr:hypothetical protein RSOLAG22IIIB_07812 [Rhizoctonia solani]